MPFGKSPQCRNKANDSNDHKREQLEQSWNGKWFAEVTLLLTYY